MTLKLTILGCGTSGGVPRIGGDWGKCDRCPADINEDGVVSFEDILIVLSNWS